MIGEVSWEPKRRRAGSLSVQYSLIFVLNQTSLLKSQSQIREFTRPEIATFLFKFSDDGIFGPAC
jgi:hypothetical protein